MAENSHSDAPKRAGLVLGALIAVAAVANLGLAVANVALPSLGPLCAGVLLEHYWWGSVFLITLPLALIALAMAVKLVPSHVNESTEPVDHTGGVLSIFLVGALILGINFAAVPNETTLILSL